jgi:hypothetical protein
MITVYGQAYCFIYSYVTEQLILIFKYELGTQSLGQR